MFRGVTQLALDNKGRLAIPAKHRETLAARDDGHLVLTADPGRCLLLYPLVRVGADPGAADGALDLQRQTPQPAATARRPCRRRRARRAPAAFSCRRRCATTRRSTSASCSSGRATSSSCGTRREWHERDGARDRVPGRRPAARARRLLALMPRWRPRPRPARRSRRRAGDHAGRHLRRRHVRPRRPRRRILALLGPRGRLIALDRDPAAERGRARMRPIRASLFAAHGFRNCRTCSPTCGIAQVDGVLLDLGISSPQIDDAARGFSFRADGPLDMRMDPTRGDQRGANGSPRASERELTGGDRDYGEERFAQSIARAIVAARADAAHRPHAATGRARGPSRRRAHAG